MLTLRVHFVHIFVQVSLNERIVCVCVCVCAGSVHRMTMADDRKVTGSSSQAAVKLAYARRRRHCLPVEELVFSLSTRSLIYRRIVFGRRNSWDWSLPTTAPITETLQAGQIETNEKSFTVKLLTICSDTRHFQGWLGLISSSFPTFSLSCSKSFPSITNVFLFFLVGASFILPYR